MSNANSKLVMIISSGDPHVINDVALMYGTNAPKFGWMEDVVLIFWGSAQKTILEDATLQQRVMNLNGTDHLSIWACKACSDNYGISDNLEQLGITVKYVGEEVSRMLKQGWHALTF